MTQTVFGPGVLYVTRTDITNGTPINVGYANEFSLNFKANMKDLYGQNQFPIDVARGTVKPTAKAKAAVFSATAMNSIFFGETFQSGGIVWNLGEAGTVPGSTSYTIQVVNHATFDEDLGVVYASNLLPLAKVASVSAAGQYSGPVSGTYTFDSADANAKVLITYTSTTANGQTLPITNHLLGYNPTFQLDYYTTRTFNGTAKPFVVRLFNCVSGSMTLDFKLEDFSMPEFDIDIIANGANNVGDMYFPEIN